MFVSLIECLTLCSGLDFLWIDALCIIQGTSDWDIESGHMASVYGGALVCLAASSAENVYQGFLRRSQQYNGGFIARVSTGTLCRVRRFFDHGEYRESITKSYLAGRAWTLQERLLPARILYFCATGLWWECQTQVSSEYLPDPISYSAIWDTLGSLNIHKVQKPLWYWSELVKEYSTAALTNESDRLPALSGLAAQQQERSGCEYLAGIWGKLVIYQLLWRVRLARRPRPAWRAPTWSWASIDGRVNYPLFYCLAREEQGTLQVDRMQMSPNKYIRVLKAKTTLKGTDTFGQVIGGEITLTCSHLVRGRLGKLDGPQDLHEAVPFDTGMGVFPVELDCWEEGLSTGGDDVYLLPVLNGWTGNGWTRDLDSGLGFKNELAITGLVVQAHGHPRGEFHRVGFFSYSNWEKDEAPWYLCTAGGFELFLKILEEVGGSVARTMCAQKTLASKSGEEHEERRHVITIV